MQNIVTIHGLRKNFGNRQILNGIDVSIPNGGIFGIVGLNGAGKTTLIKCILSLIPDFEGKIMIDGMPSIENQSRKNVAYMPEKFAPNSNITGYEYIKFYAKLYNVKFDINNIHQIAQDIELSQNFLKLKIGQCSKGTIQKIGVLACLYVEAKIVILDEPTTGLDILSRYSLKKMLQKYSIKQTIIFSSHILSDVEELAQNVAIVVDGAVVFTGTPKDFILNQKTKNFEEAFITVCN